MNSENDPQLSAFLSGKPAQTIMLFHHFFNQFEKVGKITIYPAKTMIGISNGHKRVAWITQLGKNFVHVVFPFKHPYNDNLCFQKIAHVPDDNKQFNHHFRMYNVEDVNEEVIGFIRLAYFEENK